MGLPPTDFESVASAIPPLGPVSAREIYVGRRGNPWIFAGFTDGSGTSVSDATLLGRCEQLSKVL